MNRLYIETYGCQMNFADSEVVCSIMNEHGYNLVNDIHDADVVFINTCSIRENAENKIFNRLKEITSLKKKNHSLVVGILGCMAERLKDELIAKADVVDLIVGPDAYRNIPSLIEELNFNSKAINTQLSLEETYSDIQPVRIDSNGVTAFISITRGCENYCTYCVVPYTRGRERSRDPKSIIAEAKDLFDKGYREVTLLGQNVNSYKWVETTENGEDKTFGFSYLMEQVALVSPLLRVRFATSHPKDLSDELLNIIAKYDNICKFIHLPLQSGSSSMLARMNRKYDQEKYLNRIEAIKRIIPDCSIGTDIIAGFSGETEEEHQETLKVMNIVEYDYAYMFKYSERPGTFASKHLPDDVPEDVKGKRLTEIIELQQELSLRSNKKDIGKTFEVLVEGKSKRNDNEYFGRNSQNKVLVFPASENLRGKYIKVKVKSCTAATLIGELEE